MKAFLGISKNGKTSVTISYETLSEKSSYGRTQTMLAVNELVSMGYISKNKSVVNTSMMPTFIL